jgi:hypothetical protein
MLIAGIGAGLGGGVETESRGGELLQFLGQKLELLLGVT